jgi:hypothetical protein
MDSATWTERQRDFAVEYFRSLHGSAAPLPENQVLQTVFRALSRQEELGTEHRDRWGNWEWPFCESSTPDKIYRPWVDELAGEHLPAETRNGGSHRWPKGKAFAVCLTHDVDQVAPVKPLSRGRRLRDLLGRPNELVRRIKAPLKSAVSLLRGPRGYERPADFDLGKWLEMEDRFGFRSSFFFFPEEVSARHEWDCTYRYEDVVCFQGKPLTVAGMMKVLDASGWDVGLHGSIKSATTPGVLQDEKQQIEKVLGHPIIGVRQHYLQYCARRTPLLQAAAGLLVDSTQGYNRSIGFRAGTAFPYRCWDHERQMPLSLLEIPQHVMDGGLFTPNALEYNEEMAVKHCISLMDRVEKVGGCLTLNWHPDCLDRPLWVRVYQRVLAEAHRRGACGTSAAQIYRWWIETRMPGQSPA